MQNKMHGAMPGQDTPVYDKHRPANDPHGGQTGPTVVRPANAPKQLATLCARSALAGIVLHVIDDDHGQPLYIVSRWALTKAFDNLTDLATWLDRATEVRHA